VRGSKGAVNRQAASRKGIRVNSVITYELEALTDVWTGSTDGQSRKLVTTGLLGSIRWWFEVLVRGLGGSACDPTATGCEGESHCVACELFGCTGWARKFRFEAVNESKRNDKDAISKGDIFKLRFTELRPVWTEEWALLDLTLRLIAEYGAIGGKTVYKPSDDPERAGKPHHKDYGLVRIRQAPVLHRFTAEELRDYVCNVCNVCNARWQKVEHGEFAWASLSNFWCVNGKWLGQQGKDKSTFNQVLGRQQAKKEGQRLANRGDQVSKQISKWLAGSQQESKKVFSFKNPGRTFGFVKPGLITLKDMRRKLEDVWRDKGWEFLSGETIIEKLVQQREKC